MKEWTGKATYTVLSSHVSWSSSDTSGSEVSVRLDPKGISFLTEGVLHVYPWSELRTLSTFNQTEISHQSPGKFKILIRDTQLSQFFRENKNFKTQKSFKYGLGGVAVMALIGTLVLLVWAIISLPKMANWALHQTPWPIEKKMGDQLIKTAVPADTQTYSLPNIQARKKIDSLIRVLPGADSIPFTLHWVKDSSQVNAFAFPGGHIVVFEGLLRELESQEELIPIIFHEAGHVVYRHSLEKIGTLLYTKILLSLLLGDLGGLGGVLVNQGEFLFQNSYSRKAEKESDEYALHALDSLGWSAQGMESFFHRLSEKQKSPKLLSILSTHPASQERRDAVKRRGLHHNKPIDLLDSLEWLALKNFK